jgi:hypothetical protein
MEFDSRLDLMQDYDINNRSKKLKENLENTLGEIEPLRV